MKVIAGLSAFLFVSLATMFGTNASPSPTDLVTTALSTLLFVGGTSLILGIVFGRSAQRSATVFGGLALFIMWLPLQIYATEESLIRSGIALLLTISALALHFFVGATVRKFVAARISDTN